MGKRVLRFGLVLGLLFLLSGCLSQAGEEFYALPQLPEDYVALQQTINTVMSELGAEYAAPVSGSNTQNIQLQDLDGDGTRESAVAFFRVASAEEKPLKIYVFRQNQTTEEYETAWIVEGEGTGVYSVSFENLGGTSDKEMVISWQISTKVQSLSAYSLQYGGNAVELMRSGYAKYAVMDMDKDNEKELILIQLDTAENICSAELYDYNNGLMVMRSTAPLSTNITSIQSAQKGYLTNLAPALFVSSDFGEKGGRVTDIITMQDDALCNLTLEEESGMSLSTIRYYTDFQDANGLDINGDGILDMPMPEAVPQVGENTSQLYLLHWFQYAQDGTAEHVCTTFHNYDDGWYMVLPESWQGQVTVARRDSSGSAAGSERAVSFYYYYTDDEGEAATEEFLTVYRLTGTNRTFRASLEGRFIIFESSDVIYAARFRDSQWNCGLGEDGLREAFNRIKIAWSSEN